MLVCIPTNGSAGIGETLCDHFGSAPYFTLYDSGSGEIQIVKNRNTTHAHGTCHPMTQLAKYRIDSIVCSGIGRRAIEMLNNEGVKVYGSDKKTVGEVVEQVKGDDLSEIDAGRACLGRGHGQGFVHGLRARGVRGTRRGREGGTNRRQARGRDRGGRLG